MLNLKPYKIIERATGIAKLAYLPYSVQIHKSEMNEEYFIVNAYRLIPNEEPIIHKDVSKGASKEILEHLAQIDSLSRQLRPELSVANHNNEPASDMQYYTWAEPQQCSECGAIIQEYTYYFYSKRSVNPQNSVLNTYYCCLTDYNKLAPTDSLQVPVNKLQLKELPGRLREPFWLHTPTGTKYSEPQFKKIMLNPDAFMLTID